MQTTSTEVNQLTQKATDQHKKQKQTIAQQQQENRELKKEITALKKEGNVDMSKRLDTMEHSINRVKSKVDEEETEEYDDSDF